MQIYRLAAGGSRERPSATQFYRRRANRSPSEHSHRIKVYAGLVAGAACCQLIDLPTCKAAPLQTLASDAAGCSSTYRMGNSKS